LRGDNGGREGEGAVSQMLAAADRTAEGHEMMCPGMIQAE